MLKQESVQIEFTYENDVTEKDLKNIARKVETFRKNCGYDNDVAFLRHVTILKSSLLLLKQIVRYLTMSATH